MIEEMLIGLRLAVRSGYLRTSVFYLLTLAGAVMLAAEFSARQPATVALDVGLSFIRIVLPILIVLLIQELVAREFERRQVLHSLTYPRPRAQWLIGRLAASGSIAVALIVASAITVIAFVKVAAIGYEQSTPVGLAVPFVVTVLFFSIDIFVVISVATLLSVTAKTPSFVLLGSAGFIVIARSYMPIIQLMEGADYLVDKFADPRLYKSSLSALSFILPDLGTLDVRMIALYGRFDFLPQQWWFLLASALVYGLALIAIAVWWLRRRELP